MDNLGRGSKYEGKIVGCPKFLEGLERLEERGYEWRCQVFEVRVEVVVEVVGMVEAVGIVVEGTEVVVDLGLDGGI